MGARETLMDPPVLQRSARRGDLAGCAGGSTEMCVRSELGIVRGAMLIVTAQGADLLRARRESERTSYCATSAAAGARSASLTVAPGDVCRRNSALGSFPSPLI